MRFAVIAIAVGVALSVSLEAEAVTKKPAPVNGQSGNSTSPNYGGYGRGWCYWHPYRCYFGAQQHQ